MISIADLVETTWLSRYSIPIEITYKQGSEFIGREFRKSLIETEYGITAKPSTSGNPMSNAVLEYIHQVLGNLVWTYNITQSYVDVDDTWSGILAAAEFEICSTTNSRGLGAKLCACASASSARNSQYAQLTHSTTIENRVSDLRRHAHFNID